MTDPEIPAFALIAASDAWHDHYCGEDRACVPADHCEGAPDEKPLRAALIATLPHLRVQETRGEVVEHSEEDQWYCPTSDSIECYHAGFDVCCDAPEKHVALSFDLVEKAVAAYHAAPAPRPVVDREAIWRALYDVWQNPKELPLDFASEGADAVLALLNTKDAPVAIVHCGDMEQRAVSFNEGYAEAQRQGIGGPESRVWVTEKIETVLGPLASLRPDLAVLIADQLLSEADVSDLSTEEDTKGAAFDLCRTAKGWGECVLANGHETREQAEVGAKPMECHVDRWGRMWGVGQGGN